MVLNMSHEDKQKYKEGLKERKPQARRRRTAKLSDKTKNLALKQFQEYPTSGIYKDDVQIDDHVKMNDNYMRTGPSKPRSR